MIGFRSASQRDRVDPPTERVVETAAALKAGRAALAA